MIDAETRFSDRQAITATAVSENVVELDPSGQDVGAGEPIYLNVYGSKPTTNPTSFTIELQTDNDSAMGNAVVTASHPIQMAILSKGGSIFSGAVPTGMKAYARLRYVVAGSPVGFNVTSWLGRPDQTNNR